MAVRKPTDEGRLDWSKSWGGDTPQPCMYCHRPTFLRHPLLGKPSHKVCAEDEAAPPTR